jgi:hypothetical protein
VVTAAHYRNIATYISETRPFAKTGSGQTLMENDGVCIPHH